MKHSLWDYVTTATSLPSFDETVENGLLIKFTTTPPVRH
jgi:hypothetical protein